MLGRQPRQPQVSDAAKPPLYRSAHPYQSHTFVINSCKCQIHHWLQSIMINTLFWWYKAVRVQTILTTSSQMPEKFYYQTTISATINSKGRRHPPGICDIQARPSVYIQLVHIGKIQLFCHSLGLRWRKNSRLSCPVLSISLRVVCFSPLIMVIGLMIANLKT